MRTMIVAAAAACLVTAGALAQAPRDGKVVTPLTQAQFVVLAASGDMLEIESSKLALERARGDRVKEFARQMIEDHTRVSNKMKDLARSKGIGLPVAMTASHAAQLARLRTADANVFDKAYIGMQVDAHEEAVELLRNYSQNASADKELQDLAAKTLPTVQEHLRMAKDIDAGKKAKADDRHGDRPRDATRDEGRPREATKDNRREPNRDADRNDRKPERREEQKRE